MKGEPKTSGKQNRKARRFRWRIVLAILVVLLALAAVLVNGPGFRWVAGRAARKALDKAGYSGDIRIDGTLWSGVKTESFRLESTKDATEVEASGLRVEWDLPSVVRGGLPALVKSIELEEARAVIDLSAKPEKKEGGKGLPHEVRFPLREFPIPKVRLGDVSATILLPEGREVVMEGLHLEMEKGKEGSVALRSLELPDGRRWENLESELFADADRIALRDLAIMEGWTVREAEVRLGADGGPLEFEAWVDAGGAALRAQSILFREAAVRLEGGALQTAEVLRQWGFEEELPVGAEVTRFEFGWSGEWEQPAGWKSNLDIGWGAMEAGGFDLNEGSLGLRLERGQLSGPGLTLRAGENRVDAVVEAPIPAEFQNWTLEGVRDLPVEVRLELEAPALRPVLEEAGIVWGAEQASGSLRARWRGERPERIEGEIDAQGIGDGKMRVPAIQWRGTMADAAGTLDNHLQVELGGANTATFEVGVQLDDLTYGGSGQARLGNLADVSVVPHPETGRFAGAVVLDWSGSGSLTEPAAQSGSASLALEGVQLGNSVPVSGQVGLQYAEERVALDAVDLQAEEYRLQASGSATLDTVELETLTLRHGESILVQGTMRVPYDRSQKGLDALFESQEPAELRLNVERLSLEKVMELAGLDQELRGELNVHAEFLGPARELAGEAQITVTGLEAPDAGIEPADVELGLRLASGEVVATGQARQPRLEAIEVEVRTRFVPADWEAQREAPLSGRVRLPATGLEWLPGLVGGIETLEGTVEAEVQLAGTVSHPVVTGSAGLQAARIELADARIAPFRDVRVAVRFEGQQLRLEQLEAEMAGGRIQAGGTAGLTDWANPELDLRLTSERALLQRDESMILRANADLRVTGPWTAALVEGTLALTESRYYKTIELVPANVRFGTGAPEAPQRRESPLPRYIEIEIPPFDNWRFDVRVTGAQPFRVRSNLMTADVIPDLRVTGQGRALGPVGRVGVTEGFLTLPFSRMELEEAELNFTPDTGIPGGLRVLGWSEVGDYRIRMMLGGNLNNVRSSFTSNPPLSQEDILSLLATGTTREELLSGENVAATRAATLMLQQAWRRFRGKRWSEPSQVQRNPLTIEPIGVDPRTGRNLAAARLRLLEWLYLQGSTDVEGEFRGLIKLLFEF